jgi:hypothetical protein
MKNKDLWQSPVKPLFVKAARVSDRIDYFIRDVFYLITNPSWWHFQWIISEYFNIPRYAQLLDLYESINEFYYDDNNTPEGSWGWFINNHGHELYNAKVAYYNKHKSWWMPNIKVVTHV